MSNFKKILILLILFTIPVSFPQYITEDSDIEQSFPGRLSINHDANSSSIKYIYENEELISNTTDYNEVVDIIVEFVNEPMFVQIKKYGLNKSEAFNSLQMIFNKFEEDLHQIHKTKSSTLNKNTIQPSVKKYFYNIFFGVSLSVPLSYLAEIRKLNYLKHINLDEYVEANNYLEESLNQINVPQVWQAFNTKGEGIVVGTLDTGIDYLHPALGGGFGPGYKVIGGYDLVNDDPDPMDDNHHGTHVAGIIAADGDSLTGVAPQANLMAFKVLNENGRGQISKVIEGIEMALDPNNDCDISDMVDILNISLSSDNGYPDDPMSVSVDNAVMLGMTICASAGNKTNFLTIGSPGTALGAITVGACNNFDVMAPFSSKGPNRKLYSIKPEISAPGVDIISSFPNGQYSTLSGTSMSAPHVSGVCALIKSLHPEWSPENIKSTIMTTAKDLGREIMIQGAGRIDAYKSAKVNTLILPSALNYGFDAVELPNWLTSDTLTVINNSLSSQNYFVSSNGTINGIVIDIQPSSFVIPSGESQKVVFTLNVDNNIVNDRNEGTSLSYSGFIYVNGSIDTLSVPWAFTKTQRVVFQFDYPLADFILINRNDPGVFYFLNNNELINPFRMEFINVPEGLYDLYALLATDEKAPSRIIIKPINIGGSSIFNFTQSDTPNLIDLDGVDNNGQLLAGKSTETGDYKSRFALVPGSAFNLPSLATLTLNSDSLFISNISSNYYKVYSSEFYNDLEYDGNVYLIQHNTVTDLSNGDIVILQNESDSLRSQKISTKYQPDNINPHQRFLQSFAHRTSTGSSLQGLDASLISIPAGKWSFTYYTNPDIDPQAGFVLNIAEASDTAYIPLYGYPQLISNDIRVYNDKIISYNNFNPSPIVYTPVTDLEFGLSPIVPGRRFWFNNSSDVIKINVSYIGPLGENRIGDVFSTTFAVYDNNNSLIHSGNVAGPESGCYLSCIYFEVDPGIYKTKFLNRGYFVGEQRGKATLTSYFDTEKNDNLPPIISSLKLLNSSDILVDNLLPQEAGKLLFSAGDYVYYSPLICKRVLEDSTHLFVKQRGSTQWNEVPITKILENYESFNVKGHYPIGSLYSADLSLLQNISDSFIDIKIVIHDNFGNWSEWILEPGFSIGDPVAGIDENEDANLIPEQYKLYQNYPNPFNTSTVINYELPIESTVSITLYDLMGQEIKTLVNADKPAGIYTYTLDSSALASGIYFYRIQADNFVQTRKMILLK